MQQLNGKSFRLCSAQNNLAVVALVSAYASNIPIIANSWNEPNKPTRWMNQTLISWHLAESSSNEKDLVPSSFTL